jgi:hypothetical protein
MNAEDVHILRINRSALSQAGSPALREGSFVSGRILDRTGDQSYRISLAGHCISVFSEKLLMPGSVFTATVRLDGNRVLLVLPDQVQNEHAATVLPVLPESVQSRNPDNHLVQLLSTLGLPVAQESVRMIQFVQELGIKISVPDIRLALAVAREFPASEEEAAQYALLLSVKGLPVTADAVRSVMHQKHRQGFSSSGTAEQSALPAKSDTSSIYDYFSSVDTAARENEPGLLTFFNMTGTGGESAASSDDGAHWIILPFAWDTVNADGVIRVLCVPSAGKIKKIVVNCHVHMKNYVFVVYFKTGAVDKVIYAADSFSAAVSGTDWNEQIRWVFQDTVTSGQGITVECVPYEKLAGFCAGDVSVSVVRGTV